MKSKKQRRFERRLAERKLRRQRSVVTTTNAPSKAQAAEPADRRVRREYSKNSSPSIPGFQEPGKSGAQKQKEMN